MICIPTPRTSARTGEAQVPVMIGIAVVVLAAIAFLFMSARSPAAIPRPADPGHMSIQVVTSGMDAADVQAMNAALDQWINVDLGLTRNVSSSGSGAHDPFLGATQHTAWYSIKIPEAFDQQSFEKELTALVSKYAGSKLEKLTLMVNDSGSE